MGETVPRISVVTPPEVLCIAITAMSWNAFTVQWIVSQQPSLLALFYLSSTAALGYMIFLALYRVYLSPLAFIPGPKLAAMTYLYETYYEVYKGGQYFRAIDLMHAKYGQDFLSARGHITHSSAYPETTGPLVRITPNEVHFDDPDFHDVLFPRLGKRKVDRPAYAAARAGTPGSIVATVEHDVHRRRRNAMNSFFSGASVRRLEPILQEHMEKMLCRMQSSGMGCEVVELHHMFKACASDIITLHAFGDSFRFMDQPDYGQRYFRAGEAFNSMTHVFGAFPWLLTIAASAPGWLFKYLKPDMAEFVDRKEWWIEKVRDIRSANDPERAKNTIFGGILDSSLPAKEKTDQRLANEAQLVVFAGEGTTAHTLTSAVFHLLAKPETLRKVKDELRAVVTDGRPIPTFQQLDQLEYMNAVVHETIRLHPGAMHRQVRVCPHDSILYVDKVRKVEYVVPPGTVYGVSPLKSHMNGGVFKDPYEFVPERWIKPSEISRAFMGFSRGTRGCVGIALAWRELVATLATIFMKYDVYQGQPGPTLELYDTVRARDIDAARDYITPLPTKGSMGLRVRIRE